MNKIITVIIGLGLTVTGFSQGCLNNGIWFSNQEQVDSFMVNYPGCTVIFDDVLIQEEIDGNIKNLSGLSVLTGIQGKLTISENDSLASLAGLDSLNSLEALNISYNNILTDLTALTGLTSLESSCTITNNSSLNSLSGLDNIGIIRGALLLMDNNALTGLEGLGSLTEIASSLYIGNSYPESDPSIISSLAGLANLEFVGGDLQIVNNGILRYISGMSKIDGIGGNLVITNNDSLRSLTGLEMVTSLEFGKLEIQMNPCLTDLTGLDNLYLVYESFICANNINLVSLTGLENLTYVHGSLVISNNPVLSSLSPLSGLIHTGVILNISSNDALTSLDGLENIGYPTFSLLKLTDNKLLCNCAVKSVCDFLGGLNSNTIIHDNEEGCNSIEEIETACLLGFNESSSDEIPFRAKIFPNPSSDFINIELDDYPVIANYSLTVVDLNGRQLISQVLSNQVNVLDIHLLPKGVYVLRLTNNSTLKMLKLTKF